MILAHWEGLFIYSTLALRYKRRVEAEDARNLCRRDRAYGLCMIPISGHTTGSSDKGISHSYTTNLHLLSRSIWEEHPSHASMCSSCLKSTFSNGWKEDEKLYLWRYRPLRNTRKCNQQWPMLDSTNPRDFINIPDLHRGSCACNSGTSTW